MKRFAAKKGRDEKENTMNTETAKATIEDSLRKDIGPYFQKYPKLSAVTAIPRWDRYMGRFDMWIEETRASFDGKATIAIQDEVTKAFRKAATSIIRCLESLGRVSDGYVDYPGVTVTRDGDSLRVKISY